MERYPIRAFKYFIYLIVLFFIIYLLMVITKTTTIPINRFSLFLTTSEGWILIGAIIVLCLAYPFFGFVKRPIYGNITENRDIIISLFEGYGFKLFSEKEGVMEFKAVSNIRKLGKLFEDSIKLDASATPATLSGNRKAVTKILFRLEPLLKK